MKPTAILRFALCLAGAMAATDRLRAADELSSPQARRGVERAPGILPGLALDETSGALNESISARQDAGGALLSSPQARRGFGGETGRVYRAQVNPHWFHNDTRFWYRNDLRGGTREFIVVDADKGTRQPAFDHGKLAAALSKAAMKEFSGDRLPFDSIEFVEEEKAVRFEAAGKTWKCNLSSYECLEAGGEPAKPNAALERAPGILPGLALEQTSDALNENISARQDAGGTLSPQQQAQQQRPRGAFQRRGDGEGPRGEGRSLRSPDGKWTALIKEHNVFVRAGEEEFPLTKNGESNGYYGRLEWSPNSQSLVAWRIEPAERKEVYLIQSSPAEGGRATLRTRGYALPGDKFTTYELNVFDVAARKQLTPGLDRFEHEWLTPRLRWNKEGDHFTFQKTDRGHQRFRLIDVDARTGATRNLIDEKTDTFIWTAHTEAVGLATVNWLEKSEEIIYASESNGWRHLYLIDAKEGKLKNAITKGEWVVRGVDRIDEEKRQVWFRASGRNAGQDPYFVHAYRVNFDGSGLVALTEGNGSHSNRFSPDRKFIIDTWSRVDQAPVNELRRTEDGKLVCKLEEADVSELKERGWEPPEVFVAKGRDGKTDIWGIIVRPRNLDPSKKYPVIEDIYAGPQGSFVPKTFSSASRYRALNDLGFIVAKMDGMGTANRSKAFHDVCWKNLKDAGFEDRILWHQAVAKKYPYYDTTRVGIYGTSAGGQNAAGAVLFHPEFYKAAVANCGCHDNRMDKASWNEQWMGYPVGPQYGESSNIDNAGRLRGRLMLVVGELDNNVPPESTYRLVDALIKANKDFDLLVVPNGGHGAGGAYGQRRLQDFFVRHLLGTEPPNRNAEPARRTL